MNRSVLTWLKWGVALVPAIACGGAAGVNHSGSPSTAYDSALRVDGATVDGGDGGGRVTASCNGGPCNAVPAGLLDPGRTTRWSPGILADDQLHLQLGRDGLPVRTKVCAAPMPGADLNLALAGCPEGQVVQLAPGTYPASSVVVLTKGVVLRGAGSGGAAKGGTTIVRTGGGSVLAIGGTADRACYSGGYGTPYALTRDALKETATIDVGLSASNFAPGDLAFMDEVDDPSVQEGDCPYFKRVDKRSVGERVEVRAVDSARGTITLSSPLHWTFRSAAPYLAQIAKVTLPVVRWAGIENLAVQGGSNPGYPGQAAGGIDLSDAAYSWVKDVQTDGTIGGMHVALTGTFRSVLRDSDLHNSANYGFGSDCYGIVVRCGAADNLVENNVARYMNKPISFSVSGGGNVVGYNYVDNSWAAPADWQELNIDTHCAFPHMELMEGNYAPHMGASITHGNAGYMTYFRNYSSSQFAPPAVFGAKGSQTGNVAAVQFDSGDIDMTVIGNVLGSATATDLSTATVSTTYVGSGPGAPCIFEIGDNSSHRGVGMSDVAYTSLWWHGNFDTVSNKVVWNPAVTPRTLPSSLYLSSRPGWWPAGQAWPWAGSDLTPMVGALPAKTRSDATGH